MDRVCYHLRTSAVFVGSRSSNVLVVIVPHVLICDGSFGHNSILKIIDHLVLGVGLYLEGTNATLFLEQLSVQYFFFPLKFFQLLFMV